MLLSRRATTASASITKRTPKLPDFAKTDFLVKRMSNRTQSGELVAQKSVRVDKASK
jgi:hypothetical protein